MKKHLPPYCYRLGAQRNVYFRRRPRDKALRIKAKPGSDAFALEYAKLLNGYRPKPTTQNFGALIDSYEKSERFSHLARRTKQDYDKVLRYIRDKVGHLEPAKMERQHIIKMRDANRSRIRFANYTVQIIRVLFEHAIDIGWMEKNPAKGVTLLKSESEPRKPWPQDMIDAYRATAKGRALLVFEMCIGTGQRIGDVLKMKWGDIEGDGINVTQNKTKAKVWVPFTARLRDAISAAEKRSVFILTNEQGTGAWSYRGASQAVRKTRIEIGAEDYDIHALRHTAATELAQAGCSDELIMAVTGHSSSAMVKLYSGQARQRTRAKEAQEKRK